MSYVYPFAAKKTTTREDQGQDFGGTGSILAIGNAKILSATHPSGWPGTGGVLYQLLDGPAKGKVVYVYEGVEAKVRAGQTVKAGQSIAKLIPGTSTGIEMGWANAAGEPLGHAEYDGVHATKVGVGFGHFLSALQLAGSGKESEPGLIENALGIFGQIINPGASAVEGAKKAPEAVSSVAGEVESGIAGDLAKHGPTLMLNVGLVFGGAFLIYYGAGLVLGAKNPGGAPPALQRAVEGMVAK